MKRRFKSSVWQRRLDRLDIFRYLFDECWGICREVAPTIIGLSLIALVLLVAAHR